MCSDQNVQIVKIVFFVKIMQYRGKKELKYELLLNLNENIFCFHSTPFIIYVCQNE